MSIGGFSSYVLRASLPLLILFTGVPSLRAQMTGLPLIVRGSYTTSAKLYMNPRSPSPTVRNELIDVTGLTGVGAEIQIPMSDDGIAMFVSFDYLSYVEEGKKPVALSGVLRSLPVRDGFYVVPVEVGAIGTIPIAAETMRLTMAAGVGVYFGSRILKIVDVNATTVSAPPAYGITVSIGFDYLVMPAVWFHGETRFRDPELTLEWKYDRASTVYQGSTLVFPSSSMHTKVNVDGFSVACGLLVNLSEIL